MTQPERAGSPGGPSSAGDKTALLAATASLRAHVDDRWVEVADRVLSRALTATRGSLPVLAQAPGGPVQVSEQVLVAYVRAAIADVEHVAPSGIHVLTDDGHRCVGVVIEVTVQYGQPVIPVADRIRDLTEAVLARVLGPVAPPVTVTAMHVHVADVSTTDPRTGRPPRSQPPPR